jgi:hypothetical protein
MRKSMYKKLIGIVVFGLLITTAISAVGIMTEKEKPILLKSQVFNTGVHDGYTIANPNGVVLWDNGLHYHGSIMSIWDDLWPFEAIGADDFQFEETTVITDVHWVGGYWNPGEDGDFDWNVSFYNDQGEVNAPGDKIYEEVFPNAMVHETFIEEIWNGLMFSYWVDLAEPITFTGGDKYWISIQGVGNAPPDSYWGCNWPQVLHQAVFKCSYFGFPDWTDSNEVWGTYIDFCFQLTGDGEPVIPDLECEGDLQWDGVHAGEIVNGSILVFNNGNVGSMLRWEVQSVPSWGANWTLNWTKIGQSGPWVASTDYGYVGTTESEEIFVEVKAPEKTKKYTGEIILVNSDNQEDTCIISVSCTVPRTRATYNPLLQHLFERFPYAFPILRQLLGL